MPGAYLWAWDGANWIKVECDINGYLKVDMSAINLDDLADVRVPAPGDQNFLYWDATAGEWTYRILVDADIPAAIARDAEVATAVSDHAALTTGIHGVGALGFKLTSKVKVETRDMGAASGDVSYTGYGFEPTCLIVFACFTDVADIASWGFADSAMTNRCIRQIYVPAFYPGVTLVDAYIGVGNRQYATLTSYDADGFTLTWTKTGTPTGILSLQVLALR